MARWNFHDIPNQDKGTQDEFSWLIQDKYKIPDFKVYQVFEATFRALMSDGVTREIKDRGPILIFGGYAYDTFPDMKDNRTLDYHLRKRNNALEVVKSINELCNQIFSKHKQELGLTRLAVVKLENLNIAMADYNTFLKSLDNSSFVSGNPTISEDFKADMIEKFQKAIAKGLEVADRAPDEMISFSKDGTHTMKVQPHLFTYFNDYIVASYIYWGAVLKKVFTDKDGKTNPNVPINQFIVDKLRYDHFGNQSENLKFDDEFFETYFNIGRIRKRLESARASALFKTREKYFLEGSLGEDFIDKVLDISGLTRDREQHQIVPTKEWTETTRRIRFGKVV